MKTRRSYFKSNYECDQLNCELSIQSVLFPIAHNRSKKTIVPETPGNYNASNNTNYAASVLETPDDFELNPNGRNNDELCIPIAVSAMNLRNELNATDASFLETTPDLKLTNRKGIISILESEYSSTKLSEIRVNGNDKRTIIDRNRRKTLSDKILPFDLNDEQTLSKKMPLLKNCKKIRKSSVNSIDGKLNQDKCLSLPLVKGIDKNSRKSSNELNNELDRRSATIRCSLPGNKTIIFEKSCNLDLTDANIHANNILQNNLSNAIQSLLTNSSQIENDDNHPADAAGDNTFNCNEFLNQVSSLSFQKFNSDAIKVFEEKIQINSKDFSCRTIMSQNTPIKNVNKQDQGESCSFNREIFHDTLSPTQPAYTLTLLGVIAFVDVRSGSENRSSPIKDTLSTLGAIVLEKFTIEVTHVVFRDGSKSIFERATQRGLHLVSPLWVDACRVKLVRVSESLFPISNYPKAHGVLAKSRKLKSMQPRDFEEDEMVMVARIKKRLQSATSSPKLGRAAQLPESPNTNRENINSPLFGIEHLLTPNRETDISPMDSSFEESNREFDVPLASRMYNRFVTPSKNFSTPLRKEDHRIPLSPLVNIMRLPNIECASAPALAPSLNKKQNRRITRSQVNCLSPGKCHNEIEMVERDFSINSKPSCNEDNVGRRLSLQPEVNFTSNFQGSTISMSNCSFKTLPTCLKYSVNEKTDACHKENQKKRPVSNSGLTCRINDRPIQKESSLFQSNGNNTCENTISSSLSGLSQPLSTASRRHRLHTVDCDIPEHDLIVPSTPRSVSKCHSSIYNDIIVNDSTTQRMAMKNLRRKALNDDALLPLPRKVRRCSLQLPKSNTFDSSVEEELTVKDIPKSQKSTPKGRFSLIPKDRGSLEEFQNKTISRRRRRRITATVLAKPVASICITSFHSGDIGSVYAIIKTLGDFKVTEEVELGTTHIICGSERRTMNVLFGIAKGCWILDVSWLYESVELLKWAPEEPFELFNFCPGAKKHRLLKENRSSTRKTSLFFGIGRICILDSCSPKLPVMKSLLQMCGANLCSTIRSADLLIGEKKLYNSKILQVSEKWAFDSIQKWDLQDLENYVIQ